MAAEDFFIDNCGERQTVEAICERFPKLQEWKINYRIRREAYLDVIPPFAFVIEAVDSVDGSALVIASEEEEVLWVSEEIVKREKESKGLT